MFKRKQFLADKVIIALLSFLWVLLCVGCGGGGDDGSGGGGAGGIDTVTDNPPQISQVHSSFFSDVDAVYSTGRMVRLDIEESSGEADIVSGTIRITSATTGYDSGVQDLTFGSIFYHWNTTGLEPANDYIVEVTLVDEGGQETIDDSLIVTLGPNPPAINKLVSRVDVSVPAIGIPVSVERTYLLDSGFNSSFGFGWTHSYLMHVVETGDGLVKVFNADGSGSFFHPNGDGTYEFPKREFRTLTKDPDGTFQVKEKNGTLYQFAATGQLDNIEDRNGNIITFSYDANGLLTTIMDASSQETTFTYDTDHRLSAITDPSGRVVSYEYDSVGNLISFTDIDGAITQYAYDTDHNLTITTDASGRQTFYTIDADDRLANVSNEGGNNGRTFEYSVPAANQMTVTDALGNQTIYTYDNHASITEISDPSGNATTMTYDGDLNLTSLTDAAGNQTTFTYDSKGNVLTVTDAQGNTTTTTYEAPFDQIDTVSDENGNTTTFSYDSHGNLVVKKYPNGNSESFSYDGSGNLISLTDANGNTTVFEYDASGHLTGMTYPDGSSERFTYSTSGNMDSKTDRIGQTITYTYDPADRLINKSYPDSTSVSFGYDAAGNLLSAEDENGVIDFEYDNSGRLTQVTTQDGEVVSYGYDTAGNRTRLTYPNRMALDYTYDVLNRLTGISESGQMVANYSYDQIDRVIRRELQNGTYSTYDFDPSNRLLELVNRKSTAEIISSFVYTYDNVGNRLTMTTLNGLTQYTYDGIYQLTDIIYPNGSTTSFNFDSSGNRVSEVVDGDRIDYTTNNLNQYTDVNGDAYTYDANGNMTSKTTPSGITIFAYDYENRLIEVDTATETITYTYDPFGRRTSKTTAAGTTHYVHDGSRVIMEKDDSDTVKATYIHGIGKDEVLLMKRDNVDYFYSQDGLGSVTGITDLSENNVESITYNAFGMPSNVSSVGNPYLFTGREYDHELGLFYYRARYYDPEVGRFIIPDPIGLAGGNNLYTYVKNNPINFVDPLGLYPGDRRLYCNGRKLVCLASCQYFGFPDLFPDFRRCEERCEEDFQECIEGGGNINRGDPTFIQLSQAKEKKKCNTDYLSEHKSLNANISLPFEDSLVRGNVPIFGIANGTNFKEYRVEIGKGKEPTEWIFLTNSQIPQEQENSLFLLNDSGDWTVEGNLTTLDTGLKNYVYLPSHPKDHPIDLKGTYTMRLVVTGKDGSTIEDRVTVDVANVIPNAWGGKVVSTDERVILSVPEQSIMDSFRLILIGVAEDEWIELPLKRRIIGTIYEVREPGEQFFKAALLKMTYQKEAIGDTFPSQLGIYGFNSKTKRWKYIESHRDGQSASVFASVRTLHTYYAIMASELENEGSIVKPGIKKRLGIQPVSATSVFGHTLVRNTFEDGLGEFSNRDHEMGATVTLDNEATYDGTHAVKISNTHVGGNFAVNVITTPFDAKAYPLVQFDYRIPEEVKTNFLVNVSGRWYEIGFTDDQKSLEDRRVNIAHIGDIPDVVTDDQWHTARFNLYDMLRTKTGNTQVDTMIMADWDVNGYMKLNFGQNKKDATYYIDSFMITKESLAGLQTESDVVLVDNFNQMNRQNKLGGKHTFFNDLQKGMLAIDFSPKTFDGNGRTLRIQYDVTDPGSYAGYSSGLQNLDLRGFQRLSFLIRGETQGLDCMVGIRDSDGNESKVQLSRYLSGGATLEWQTINIPLVAFADVYDWGHIDNISVGFENAISKKGIVYLDDLAFHKKLPALKIDDFENADQKNTIGKEHHTLVSGNAAINGKYTKSSPNGIYRISYGGNIGKLNAYASDLKSFAGWRTELGGVDCSQCQNLTMRVRGSEGGESFTVYLDDGSFRWGINVTHHAIITTDWQTITIPLAEYSEYGLDLTHLNALQVVFEGHQMSGTVYLDDLVLGPSRELADIK